MNFQSFHTLNFIQVYSYFKFYTSVQCTVENYKRKNVSKEQQKHKLEMNIHSIRLELKLRKILKNNFTQNNLGSFIYKFSFFFSAFKLKKYYT